MANPRIIYPMLLENPSFEDGLDGWTSETAGASSSVAAVTEEFYHRSKSAKFTTDAAGGSYAGVRQQKAYPRLVAGETFELRFWAKGAGTLSFSIIEMTDATTEAATTTDTASPSGSWAVFTLSHTIVSASAAFLRMRVRQTATGQTAHVDVILLGRPLDVTRGFSKLDFPLVAERIVKRSASGRVETIQLHKKEEVDFGWSLLFPDLQAKVEAFWKETLDGQPFALLHDAVVASERAWPQLVHRQDELDRSLRTGLLRYGETSFKCEEIDGF